MTKIFHHHVEISDGGGIIGEKNEFKVIELDVLAENDQFLVVNDLYFTTLNKSGSKYSVGSPLGRASIHIATGDSVWGNGIIYSLFSASRKRATSIRNAIENEVQKRFGFFGKSLDLSVITDEKGNDK